MKTVIAASKSMAGSDYVSSPPTISFKLKQRKDQEVTLPPTSFPLESSSSEEDLENLDAEEQQKRQDLRQERRRWRQMKREQFEQEKKERKLREEEQEMKRAEEANRAAMKNYGDEYERLKAMQEDENSSADGEMYDIFKYGETLTHYVIHSHLYTHHCISASILSLQLQ
jgi:flagellar motility protein MotE (MotC chaperone)